MVITKYPAIFTDNLGCDKAKVYYDNNKFYLEVRGCTFFSEGTDFDFCTNNCEDIKHNFYLKDNELIEYVLDIRIPLTLEKNKFNRVEKFILRIERQKNYYNNSLLYDEKENCHEVQGYNFRQLIIRMKKELSKDYNLNMDMPLLAGVL
ncbi:MAG: DUF6304 family protein [Clostridium sp.]|nr:DUF6304 family protein [Clostridium sp.]